MVEDFAVFPYRDYFLSVLEGLCLLRFDGAALPFRYFMFSAATKKPPFTAA
nr:hypothetical protein [Marinicella sp. W31]MDC2875409.1 hypothetical protein [Marinicella sp. W31]